MKNRFSITVSDLIAHRFSGTNANDRISATLLADTISGLGGNDDIFAGAGADYILAGDGADIVRAGKGRDIIEGNAGNDTLYGGKAADDIDGGAGNDVIYAGRGQDTITGSLGLDTVAGGLGNDIILFNYDYENYEISINGNTLILENLVVNQTTKIIGVESFEFLDQTLSFEEVQADAIIIPPDIVPTPDGGPTPPPGGDPDPYAYLNSRDFTLWSTQKNVWQTNVIHQGIEQALSQGGGNFDYFERMDMAYEADLLQAGHYDEPDPVFIAASLRQMYNINGSAPGRPVPPEILALDIERWDGTVEEIVRKYTAMAEAVKAVLPNTLIGFYSILPKDAYYGSHQNDSWRAYNDALAPIADAVDVIMPTVYLRYEDANTTFQQYADIITHYVDVKMPEALQYGKPVIPIISPYYNSIYPAYDGTEMEGEIWEPLLNKILNYTSTGPGGVKVEGALIWNGPSSVYDANHGWIRETNEFVRELNALQAGNGNYTVTINGNNPDNNTYTITGTAGGAVTLPEFDVGLDVIDLSALVNFNINQNLSDFVRLIDNGSTVSIAVDTNGATGGQNFSIAVNLATTTETFGTIDDMYTGGWLIL